MADDTVHLPKPEDEIKPGEIQQMSSDKKPRRARKRKIRTIVQDENSDEPISPELPGSLNQVPLQ